jgi:DNA-binding transcriptional LysR family regulator
VGPSADAIATFVEVVRKQSLSAAARQLRLPKSTVSRRLLRLEQQLQTKLLHRDARHVALTPAGKRFYESVFTAVDTLEAALAEVEHTRREPRGTIRLTAPADLGRMVLSSMLVAFLERYPDITLELLFTNRFVDLSEEGVDVAIRAGRSSEGELVARRLCASELQLAASPSLAGSLMELRQLERTPFVLYRARTQSIRLERGAGKRPKSVELTVAGRVSVDDYAALAELVAHGQGVGLLPSIHVQEGERSGQLLRVFPEWSARNANVFLVYPSRQQPERVKLLSAFLLERFATLKSV